MLTLLLLPALRQLELRQGLQSAFVVEDTCLLAASVTYEIVLAETKDWPTRLFGYGRYEKRGMRLSWHGSTDLFVTASWCQEMAVLLENMHPQNFAYFDL